MKLNKKIYLSIALVMLSLPLQAGRSRSRRSSSQSPERKIIITRELIAQYKETFPEYMKSKESELATLSSWTDENWVLGSWISWGLETFGPSMGLGNDFNVGKAKQFLGRMLDESKKNYYDNALNNIETEEHNVIYIEQLFSNLDTSAIKRKDREKLTDQIKKIRHTAMPEEVKDFFETDDDVFFKIGTCKLFAFHILESKNPIPVLFSSESESDSDHSV